MSKISYRTLCAKFVSTSWNCLISIPNRKRTIKAFSFPCSYPFLLFNNLAQSASKQPVCRIRTLQCIHVTLITHMRRCRDIILAPAMHLTSRVTLKYSTKVVVSHWFLKGDLHHNTHVQSLGKNTTDIKINIEILLVMH